MKDAEIIQTKGTIITNVTRIITMVINTLATFLETGTFFLILIPSLSLLYCYVPTG